VCDEVGVKVGGSVACPNLRDSAFAWLKQWGKEQQARMLPSQHDLVEGEEELCRWDSSGSEPNRRSTLKLSLTLVVLVALVGDVLTMVVEAQDSLVGSS